MATPKGTSNITADGVIGVSGKPTVIYNVMARSGAGGAAVIKIYDGTSASGTLVDILDVAAASGTTPRNYGGDGLFLAGGCFIDVDSNTAFVTVTHERVGT